MASTAAGRRNIANDTLARTTSIITWTPEASAESAFYSDANCPPLDHYPQTPHGPSRVIVINSDSLTAARALIRCDPTAARKVAVLNQGSDKLPGGGWRERLSKTQACVSSQKALHPLDISAGRSPLLFIHTILYFAVRVVPMVEPGRWISSWHFFSCCGRI